MQGAFAGLFQPSLLRSAIINGYLNKFTPIQSFCDAWSKVKSRFSFANRCVFEMITTTVVLQSFLQLFARTKVPEALSNLPYPRSTTDSLKLHNPCYFSNGRTFREHRVRENSVQDQSKLIKQIQAEVCRRVYYALGFLIQTSS